MLYKYINMVLRNDADAVDSLCLRGGCMEIRARNFRICLKTICIEDAAGIADNANDPEITRNVARFGEFPFPYTEEHALSFISSLREKQADGTESHFSIRLDNEVIGACALMNIDRKTKRAELGYWLGRRYWGMGYAKEALTLLLGFGFGRLDVGKIAAHTFKSNERSIRLLNSMGFSKDGPALGGMRDDELEYVIDKRDYSSPAGLEIIGE
jgi:8-oxo-dGTP diphosphatase